MFHIVRADIILQSKRVAPTPPVVRRDLTGDSTGRRVVGTRLVVRTGKSATRLGNIVFAPEKEDSLIR